ncbi:hypothetical protein CBM2605_A60495 [Cupriavidus neocaledonicus]|uniref:Uncharacterized protein n=1 Tax=Cupriavidus neocaledonicus TaxID=1040979 RepID=A0ABY1V6N7_9BURK|nr:hypothetical protein CBM2605_A60495 [Cupriavidus neocaledonicus]
MPDPGGPGGRGAGAHRRAHRAGVNPFAVLRGRAPLPLAGEGRRLGPAFQRASRAVKTEGFARCGTSPDHPSPRPSPHEGRGRTPCLG